MIGLPTTRFSGGPLGRKLALSLLAIGLLLHIPATTAQAAQEVDLRLRMRLASSQSEYHPPQGNVNIRAEVTRNDARTSAGQVDIYFAKDFTNPQIYQAGRFSCGLHSDTFLGSPAWRVTCISDVIDPNLTNGNGDDVIGVSANAPRKFGRYGIVGKLTPIGAVEVDGPDNQQTIYVSVGPARRETAPINITTHR